MGLATFVPTLDALRQAGVSTAAAALRELEALVTRGQTIATAVRAYETGKAARIAVPFHEVLATVDALETFHATYLPDLDYPADLFLAVDEAAQGLLSLTRQRQLFASQTTLSTGETNAFVPDGALRVPYQLRQGETLERIAAETLGDRERWWEIVELNGLLYPYIDTERPLAAAGFDEGAFDPAGFDTRPQPDRTGVPDGVRVTGELLWLPSDARVTRAQPFTDLDAELWGRDIAVVDGEVQLSTDGDLGTVAGRDNIVQALHQQIASREGDLELHPTYGMGSLVVIGDEGTRHNVELVGMETARTVRKDPRVVAIRNLNLTFADTAARASMSVDLIGGAGARQLPFNLVLPAGVIQQGGVA